MVFGCLIVKAVCLNTFAPLSSHVPSNSGSYAGHHPYVPLSLIYWYILVPSAVLWVSPILISKLWFSRYVLLTSWILSRTCWISCLPFSICCIQGHLLITSCMADTDTWFLVSDRPPWFKLFNIWCVHPHSVYCVIHRRRYICVWLSFLPYGTTARAAQTPIFSVFCAIYESLSHHCLRGSSSLLLRQSRYLSSPIHSAMNASSCALVYSVASVSFSRSIMACYTDPGRYFSI